MICALYADGRFLTEGERGQLKQRDRATIQSLAPSTYLL